MIYSVIDFHLVLKFGVAITWVVRVICFTRCRRPRLSDKQPNLPSRSPTRLHWFYVYFTQFGDKSVSSVLVCVFIHSETWGRLCLNLALRKSTLWSSEGAFVLLLRGGCRNNIFTSRLSIVVFLKKALVAKTKKLD